MIILGIETSCDETSAAVVETDGRRFCVLSNVVSSQIKIHQKYGGVVPEVAARNHVGKVLPVIEQALRNAECKMQNAKYFVDRIAVTVGPGLLTSLLVGIETAKMLSYVWKVPIVPVNHMAGHTYSSLLTLKAQNIKFPAIALLVSGGHTELVLMKKHGVFKLVGQTIDDAAGEAFDKIAKMLGLGYPGGPAIDRLAARGNPHAVKFPRAMLGKGNLDFSFSGLKTSVLYYLKKRQASRSTLHVSDTCASVQQAIVDVLVAKTVMAAKKYKVKTVMLGGGVAANRQLRRDLGATLVQELPKVRFSIPSFEYTTDNAAMIAAAGYFAKQKPWASLTVDPNLSL